MILFASSFHSYITVLVASVAYISLDGLHNSSLGEFFACFTSLSRGYHNPRFPDEELKLLIQARPRRPAVKRVSCANLSLSKLNA